MRGLPSKLQGAVVGQGRGDLRMVARHDGEYEDVQSSIKLLCWIYSLSEAFGIDLLCC